MNGGVGTETPLIRGLVNILRYQECAHKSKNVVYLRTVYGVVQMRASYPAIAEAQDLEMQSQEPTGHSITMKLYSI